MIRRTHALSKSLSSSPNGLSTFIYFVVVVVPYLNVRCVIRDCVEAEYKTERHKMCYSLSIATISNPTNPYVNKKTIKQCAINALSSPTIVKGIENTYTNNSVRAI